MKRRLNAKLRKYRMKTIRITRCSACPHYRREYSNWDGLYHFWCVEGNIDMSYSKRTPLKAANGEIPKWCPLEDEK